MNQIVIEGFAKNSTTLVSGLINEHKGSVLVHLREMKPTVNGEWAPGKGVAIGVDLVWDLVDAVRKLPSAAMQNQVVGHFPLGKDRLQVGVKEFKRNVYADVRRFYSDGDGGWSPTPKGVSVRTELIENLIALVEELAQTAVAEGLVKAKA